MLCTEQDARGVPLKVLFLFLLMHARANRSLFSASASSHKLLFVLLGSFKRVVCNSVKKKNLKEHIPLQGASRPTLHEV